MVASNAFAGSTRLDGKVDKGLDSKELLKVIEQVKGCAFSTNCVAAQTFSGKAERYRYSTQLEASIMEKTPRANTTTNTAGAPPDILKQQKSFELRYTPLIHKQILETGINREVLQRQMNAFFGPATAATVAMAPVALKTDELLRESEAKPAPAQIIAPASKAEVAREEQLDKEPRTKLLVRLATMPDDELPGGSGDDSEAEEAVQQSLA